MVKMYSLLVATFFVMFFSFDASACRRDGQLCGSGGDSACCSNNCIQVDGPNNNYCGSSWGNGGGWGNNYECRWDSDCGYNESCSFGQCVSNGWNGGGWGSCLQSGRLCGTNGDSRCCSGDCVQVDGSNNNYCR